MMSTRTSVPSARAISTSCFSPGGRFSTRRDGAVRGKPDAGEQLRGPRRPSLAGSSTAAGRRGRDFAAEEQVVGDRQVLGEVQFLVDQADAGADRVAGAGEADGLGRRAAPRRASGW